MSPELEREFDAACNKCALAIQDMDGYGHLDAEIRREMFPLFEQWAKDSERMDWIQKQGCTEIECCMTNGPDVWSVGEFGGRLSLREAIDSAMAGAKE